MGLHHTVHRAVSEVVEEEMLQNRTVYEETAAVVMLVMVRLAEGVEAVDPVDCPRHCCCHSLLHVLEVVVAVEASYWCHRSK
jgi:hypothetical protein